MTATFDTESPAQTSVDLLKVELHIHLDQTASYAAVAVLAPEITLAEYRRDFVGPARCAHLADFLTRPPRFVALLQDERGLRIFVEDLFDQLVRDSVIYAEIRFAPLLHTHRSLTPEQAVAIVERATAESMAATGVEARLILCTLRHFTPEQSARTARLVAEFRGSLVVGLDLAGDEAGFPLDAHEPAFRWAAERGAYLTAHAGEGAGADSVEETLRRLRPTRIGHGIRIVEDPGTVELVRQRGVHLEVCPSSNIQVGACSDYRQHPIDQLRRAGVSLSVNTDGRAITDVSLSREYDRLRHVFGRTNADFEAANRAALDAAFLDDGVRDRLRRALRGNAPAVSTASQQLPRSVCGTTR